MGPTRIAGIEYAAAPRAATKASALSWPPRLVVIHDTGNNSSTRFDEAAFAASRTDSSASWTSAHAYVDPGGALGSLPLNLQAWAAYSYANQHGVHIEMCRTGAGVAAATVRNTTPIVRWLCQQAGIPMVKLSPSDVAAGRSGVCGHLDITIGLGVGDHEDPGRNFDWAGFMAQVTGGSNGTMSDFDPYGKPANNPREVGVYAADVWGQEMLGTSPYGAGAPSPRTQQLNRIEAKLDATLKALGVAQADLDDIQAHATPAVDAAAVAAALAPLLAGATDKAAVLAVLQSTEGQAALTRAANAAEDS